MWFGTASGLSRYDGVTFINLTRADGLVHHAMTALYETTDGTLWVGTTRGVSRYDGETWGNFTASDGLANAPVLAIDADISGAVWFATEWAGVSRYDGNGFTTFTTEDGLASNSVIDIYCAPDGAVWFATGSGVSRYDGAAFTNLTVKDGLENNEVNVICRDRDGAMWFGTHGGGVSRYNGATFVNFTTRDGLVNDWVQSIHCAADGALWFGTEGGVSRYHPNEGQFINFTVEDGLVCNQVRAIHCDADGALWFGTPCGVSRYEAANSESPTGFVNFTVKDGLPDNGVHVVYRDSNGSRWIGTHKGGVSYTQTDGLVDNRIEAIYEEPNGVLWFGTQGGVSRYDSPCSEGAHPLAKEGSKGGFVNFTTEDGLADNYVIAIYRDASGVMRFGTLDGGVLCYDGVVWASLDARDGLGGNNVTSIHQDSDGSLWFGTGGGLTHYRRYKNAPRARIVAVTTDQRYTDFNALEPASVGTRVTFEYTSIDFKTYPTKRQYRVQIHKLTNDERPTTDEDNSPSSFVVCRSSTFDWTPEKPGKYRFEVQAIDRDLNYSDPASLTLTVVPAPHFEALQQTREELETAYRDLAEKNAQLEAAKEAAEAANRAKSTFLANVSHEIRTPLNAVLGYAQLLNRDAELQPSHRESVQTIERSGNHLLSLINEILDLSRIEAGRIDPQEADFDLAALIGELSVMFQLRCDQEKLTWRVEGPGTAPLFVHGDEGKLRQVLINLLSNAVKFTESGQVMLRVSECEMEGESQAADSPVRSRLFRFEVMDTGVGIPPANQGTIFEPFQRGESSPTKEGTGLGLAIAKKLVEVMGGEIGVESPPLFSPPIWEEREGSKGSRFFFTLPLSPATGEMYPRTADTSPQVARLAEGYSVKALVVDDNVDNRHVLSQMLSNIGCEVLMAESGEQAIQSVRANRPEIVFMDIRMPGMDGLEVAQSLVREYGRQAMKLVAVSASGAVHDQQRYLKAGFDVFIGKPFRSEEIYERLAQLLPIQYQYREVDATSALPPDVSKIKLPDHLLSRLQRAAESRNITALRECLKEMAELGSAEQKLAELLHRWRFDFNRILDLLGHIYYN